MRKPCDICGGSGVIERLDSMPKECQCAVLRRVAAAMPAQVRKADLSHEHLKLPLLRNGIQNSYFIKAAREDMNAIIKAVMMINSSKYVRMTSDRELRDIWVGSTSRKARGDDAGDVINTLEEVMAPPALCIVSLGELSGRNKAAATILEEALCIRLDRDLPMWVVSYYDRPFSNGSVAYSDAVWSLLKTTLHDLTIPRIVPANHEESAVAGLAPEPVASQVVAPRRTKTVQEPQETQESAPPQPSRRLRSVDPDPDLPKGFEHFGQGVKPSRGFSRKGD